MDNGIMFVAIDKIDHVRMTFVIFQQFGGNDVDLMLRDSLGEYKIQTTILDCCTIATSLHVASFMSTFDLSTLHGAIGIKRCRDDGDN